MRSVIRALGLTAVATLLLASSASGQTKQTKARGLDRAVFEVELFNEKGKKSGFDQLVFAVNKLTSSEMRGLGCWGAEYTLRPATQGETHFEAIFLTPEGQPIRYRGFVKDQTIEGSILWPESSESNVWTFTGRHVAAVLDGSRFEVEVTLDSEGFDADRDEDAEENDDEDSSDIGEHDLFVELEKGVDLLAFERGGFESRSCAAVGLSMSHYAAENHEGAMTFATEAYAEDVGSVEWWGTVEGDRIEGSLTWTTPDGSAVHYSFRGSRVTG